MGGEIMAVSKGRFRCRSAGYGQYPGIYHRRRNALIGTLSCTNPRRIKTPFAAITCCLLIVCVAIVAFSLHVFAPPPSKATAQDALTIDRIYVGSITNQSFRAAWTHGGGTGPGYIKWGPTPETWDTNIGTDIRANGSIDYLIPSRPFVHIAQTNLGSNQNMTGGTTYWFKFVIDGVVYGDNAETDTVYGYANCTALGAASPGRPWGITTAPDSEPQGEYIITGRVLSPGLFIDYKNGIFVMARVNNGTGDSLPLLTVSDFFDEIEYERGYYDLDLGMARNATDGSPYSLSEGTTIKLFFENPDYGTCPTDQLASTYPYWEYDTDQSVNMSTPQVMQDHTIYWWPDFIPEMTTIGVVGSVVAMMAIVSILRRKKKEV
jgi:hypothetical protein